MGEQRREALRGHPREAGERGEVRLGRQPAHARRRGVDVVGPRRSSRRTPPAKRALQPRAQLEGEGDVALGDGFVARAAQVGDRAGHPADPVVAAPAQPFELQLVAQQGRGCSVRAGPPDRGRRRGSSGSARPGATRRPSAPTPHGRRPPRSTRSVGWRADRRSPAASPTPAGRTDRRADRTAGAHSAAARSRRTHSRRDDRCRRRTDRDSSPPRAGTAPGDRRRP